VRMICTPTELGESSAPIARMIAKKVAIHQLHHPIYACVRRTSDSGQCGCCGKRNSNELCPTCQTQSGDDVENDK
jgi:hypothetical protein